MTDETHDDTELPALRGPDGELLPADPVQVVTAGLGLARLTIGATARLGRWGLGASMRVGNRVIKAAVSGETATHLIDDATHALREQARDLLGIVDDAGRVVSFQMPGDRPREVEASTGASLRRLRARGSALLAASADVDYEEPYHPAYGRILDELAPDEARILRLMAAEGPQAVVDVRTSNPLGHSQLIAATLNMIGAEAGCRYLDRVPSYLNNLERLGLVWYSEDELPQPSLYQILEAQPDVMDALRSAARAKTVRKSLHLTPFGRDFTQTCLPEETPPN